MAAAAELFLKYASGAHTDAAATISLFAEDGIAESPYLAMIGVPWRHRGLEDIKRGYEMFYGIYDGVHFENARVIVEAADVAVGEYEFIATSKRSGRRIYQLTSATLVASNDKIKHLREFQNIAEIILAVKRGGLADVDVPEDRNLEIGKLSSKLV